MGELVQVLGPGIGVRAGVEQEGRPVARRQRDGDRRSHHPGQAAQVEQPGGQHRAGVPGRDDRVGVVLGDRAYRGHEARIRLCAHRFGGLLAHLDPVGRRDERQTARLEPGRPVERHVDPVLRGVERTEDHLLGGLVAAQCVDCDARQLEPLRRREAQRLDLAALIRAAGRADAM